MYVSSNFYDRHHLDVARDLLGCTIEWDGCAGVIVETEGYAEEGDEASHLFFRKTAREFYAKNPPGTVYAYINYGIYWLLNVLAADGIVLIRAMEPTAGLPQMRARRPKAKLDTDLCSGPGKLGMAIALDIADHGTSLVGQRERGILPRVRKTAKNRGGRPGGNHESCGPSLAVSRRGEPARERAGGEGEGARAQKSRPPEDRGRRDFLNLAYLEP